MNNLPSNIIDLVRSEVESSFTPDELKSMAFEQFWNEVDTQNTYEEEWPEWKLKSIKLVYWIVFDKLTNNETMVG